MTPEEVAVGFLIVLGTGNTFHAQRLQLGVVEHQTVLSGICQCPRTLEWINCGCWLRCSDGSHQSGELIDLSCDLCRGCDTSRD